jgi:hypothetical protein
MAFLFALEGPPGRSDKKVLKKTAKKELHLGYVGLSAICSLGCAYVNLSPASEAAAPSSKDASVEWTWHVNSPAAALSSSVTVTHCSGARVDIPLAALVSGAKHATAASGLLQLGS